ncbi:hypothetical protein BS613_13555 [Listeria monocytogenes]|nr:hypothetical protein BS613_13555 [Listeria monocytogenes]
MANVHVINHPLVQHKLIIIRDKNTGTKAFRELVDEVATLMAYEITRDMELEDIQVETPLQTTTAKTLTGKKIRDCAYFKSWSWYARWYFKTYSCSKSRTCRSLS